jgi:C4-dicarboxylate-specific signal transduction histidine kinase
VNPTIARPAAGDHRLAAYVADLELEVDRLRKQGQFVRQAVQDTLKEIVREADGAAAANVPVVAAMVTAASDLAGMLHELREPPGYHPAHDQVVAIAVRPLVEQVFRWQQRLLGARDVQLRLNLETDHVEWFPARLRHVLDNLLSNALRYRDPAKADSWVEVRLRGTGGGYEIQVSDNGLGLTADAREHLFELLYRAAPIRPAGPGVGLAVVKLLVEQSGGTLTVDSGRGQGTTFTVSLPPYDLNDHLG